MEKPTQDDIRKALSYVKDRSYDGSSSVDGHKFFKKNIDGSPVIPFQLTDVDLAYLDH